MNLKKTIILGLFAVAALLYILKVELPNEIAKQDSVKLLPGLNGAQLDKIELSSTKGTFTLVNSAPKPVSSVKEDGSPDSGSVADMVKNWQLESVKGSELDSTAFSALLNAISGFKGEDLIPAADLSADRAVYGLKDPLLKVKVSAGQKSIEVQFGKKNDYLQKRYAQLVGRDDVFLVADTLFFAADKTQNDFRSKSPVQFVDSDVSAVTLKSTGQSSSESIKLSHTDSGWAITEPQQLNADDSSVSALTTALRTMQVAEFVDGQTLDLKDYGLDKPALVATVDFKESAKKPSMTIKIGAVKKELAASSSYLAIEGKPTIFKLISDPVASIKIGVDDYRQKQLFKFAADLVKEVTIVRTDGSLKLSKTDKGWNVGDKQGDDTFLKELLASLSGLTAKSFPNVDQDFGFKTPILKVTVSFSGDLKPRTLVIGNELDGGYVAGVDELTEPFVIGSDSFRRINSREEVLVKPPTPTPSLTP